MKDNELSKSEKIKTYKVYFYEVTDSRIANELISLNKYMYYTDVKPHWKSGKDTLTYFFDTTGCKDFKQTVSEIKDKLFNNKRVGE